MQQQVQFIVVTEDESGQRLDNYLASRLKGVPKSALYRIIRKGEVRVNKGRAKPDHRLSKGDTVRVPPVRVAALREQVSPSLQLSRLLDSSVLYDQDDLLIINKPAGIAVHGGSGVNLGLIEALRQLPHNRGFLELIHRLDKDTSGCIMIARKRRALKFYQEALRQRAGIQKHYLCLVQGRWPDYQQKVTAPLLRTSLPNGERIVRVHDEGKPSETRFRILCEYKEASLLEASPVTGRTHQIRVHAKHIGRPLVGDEKYGETSQFKTFQDYGFKRLFLHAQKLDIVNEKGVRLVIEAPLPDDLSVPLQSLQAINK